MSNDNKNKTWVQAAIDVEDINTAKRIAWMALDNGAEWLEIGTPLLFKYGYSIIGEIRKAVGNDAILVADYKYPYAGFIAEHVAKQGANFVLIQATYSDLLIVENLKQAKKWGLIPIFDLHINPKDVIKRVQRLEELGVEYIFTHHFSTIMDANGNEEKYDTLDLIKKANASRIKIGITSDDWDEAKDAVKNGADWIVFGYALRKPNPIVCKEWIDMIHSER